MSNEIARRIEEIKESFPADREVALVAVSKFQPVEKIQAAYDGGQRLFGESRVQELSAKAPTLPPDIEWHFIGHLQTNKVSQLLKISNLGLIQSVDSFRLLDCLEKECVRRNRVIDILLELHVAQEESKYGFLPSEVERWISEGAYRSLRGLRIRGVMGMASNTDDAARIVDDFREIAACFERLKALAPDLTSFNILSMGMSDDYLMAIREGSNLVRIGSSIFGERG